METVISGTKERVEAVWDEISDAGGQLVSLPVSVPFHCSLLSPATGPFRDALAEVAVRTPAFPVVDNVTAAPLRTPEDVRRSLVDQIEAPVLFHESLAFMLSSGAARFLHCGPERKTMRRWLGAIDGKADVVHYDDVPREA
jgi:[acyl-carrier-protein] S-malonyltransferase